MDINSPLSIFEKVIQGYTQTATNMNFTNGKKMKKKKFSPTFYYFCLQVFTLQIEFKLRSINYKMKWSFLQLELIIKTEAKLYPIFLNQNKTLITNKLGLTKMLGNLL